MIWIVKKVMISYGCKRADPIRICACGQSYLFHFVGNYPVFLSQSGIDAELDKPGYC